MARVNYAKLFTLRNDGYYQTKYKDATGKWRTLSGKDPEKLYDRLQAALNPPPPVFADSVSAWEREHSEAVGWKTAESYNAPVRRINEIFGGSRIDEITPARLQAFLDDLGKQGYSRRTVQLHHDVLNMIFSRAVLHGELSVNPMQTVSIPHGLSATRREVPDDAALRAVMARTDAPFALFALLCLYCGLRRGEALGLTYEHIDRARAVIHIVQALEFIGNVPEIKAPKTQSGVRTVPIPAVLLPLIPDQKHGYVFTMADKESPLTKIAYRRRWDAYCKELGYEITAHQLRHGYATLLYEAGVPVLSAQRRLGHANASTTMNIYTHLREKADDDATRQMDKYLSELTGNAKE